MYGTFYPGVVASRYLRANIAKTLPINFCPYCISQAASKKTEADWPKVHQHLFRARNLRYPPELKLKYDGRQMEMLMQLPRRCREIIFFWDETRPVPVSPEEEVLDLAQSLSRVPHCTNAVPCILPNSIMWLRRRFRVVEPNEALVLQGLPLLSHHQLASWSQAELMNLAGNAFCGENVMAIYIAALTAYAWPLSP